MWWSAKVNRECGGRRKVTEYMVEVNRECGGQRKLIEYVVVNES